MKTPETDDYCVAVVGTGAMGQGIAQVSAMGGMRTILYDQAEGGAAHAVSQIRSRLERLVEKGRIESTDAAAMAECLTVADDIGGLAGADAVVEAVFEDYDVKAAVIRDLEETVSSDCILASNTSSIPIASMARDAAHKGRIAGMHFFNPVPLMALVEIIEGPDTSAEVSEALVQLGKRMGRTPVVVKDAPGFLVNLGGRAYTTEGLRIVHEGVATPAQVDAIMRDCCGFRMGPFELMDLTGVDVNYPVSQIVYNGYMQDPRLRTSPLHKALFDAGRLGRKTGQGNFRYDEKGGKIDPPSPDFEPDCDPAGQVFLVEPDDRLADFCQAVGLEAVPDDDPNLPILAAPLGEDCTHVAVRTGVNSRRLVGIDLSVDTAKRVTLMTPPGAEPDYLGGVAARVVESGRAVTAISDSPGFVAQRLRGMIANLGCFMAEIGLATPEDIDVAMKLGLNYPMGPLEIVDDIGAARLLDLMEDLQDITGEERYRPSLWLKRRGLLNLPAHTLP